MCKLKFWILNKKISNNQLIKPSNSWKIRVSCFVEKTQSSNFVSVTFLTCYWNSEKIIWCWNPKLCGDFVEFSDKKTDWINVEREINCDRGLGLETTVQCVSIFFILYVDGSFCFVSLSLNRSILGWNLILCYTLFYFNL